MKKLLKSKPKKITRIDSVAVLSPIYPDSGDIVIYFMDDFYDNKTFELHINFAGYSKWYQIIDEEGNDDETDSN